MSRETQERYRCDNCGKSLKTHDNHVVIQTEKEGYETTGSAYWSRIRVVIEHHHGVHNDGKKEKADLCKKCTIEILKDALARVRKGERMSKGIESIEKLGFLGR